MIIIVAHKGANQSDLEQCLLFTKQKLSLIKSITFVVFFMCMHQTLLLTL